LIVRLVGVDSLPVQIQSIVEESVVQDEFGQPWPSHATLVVLASALVAAGPNTAAASMPTTASQPIRRKVE
jgi:hypothetical protein